MSVFKQIALKYGHQVPQNGHQVQPYRHWVRLYRHQSSSRDIAPLAFKGSPAEEELPIKSLDIRRPLSTIGREFATLIHVTDIAMLKVLEVANLQFMALLKVSQSIRPLRLEALTYPECSRNPGAFFVPGRIYS